MLWYWLCRMTVADGATTLDLQVKIEMTLYVKFFQRATQIDA